MFLFEGEESTAIYPVDGYVENLGLGNRLKIFSFEVSKATSVEILGGVLRIGDRKYLAFFPQSRHV